MSDRPLASGPVTTDTSPPRLNTDAWSYRVATGVSYVVSPPVLPLVLFGMVLLHFGAPGLEIAWTIGVVLCFFGLVPMAYVARMVRRREALSIELRDRTRRPRPLLFSAASGLGGLVLVLYANTTAVPLVAAVMGCMVVNTLLLVLITLRWKISIHATSVAGFVSTLLFVAWSTWPETEAASSFLTPASVLPLLVLIPLVMWARVRVGAHSKGQVLAGSFFGFVVPYLELEWLLRLGLFDGL